MRQYDTSSRSSRYTAHRCSEYVPGLFIEMAGLNSY